VSFDPAFFTTPAFLVTVAASVVAALVRGFTGFGSALIFIPVASAAYGPTVAAPTLLLVDFVLTFPNFIVGLRRCSWPTVLPAAIAATVLSPLGAWALAVGDITALRWVISISILLLVVLMASGWRYRSEPTIAVSASVGAVAGFLSGFAQIGGPPVIALWVSGPQPPHVIRANMFVFFALITVASATAYWMSGFFTTDVLQLSAAVALPFGLALFIGSHIFGRVAGAGYRPLAYVAMALAAIISLPVFDSLLR
jgi:uncharacterized membrane protein YfcA